MWWFWVSLGWFAGSIYGTLMTRWQMRRRERDRRRPMTAALLRESRMTKRQARRAEAGFRAARRDGSGPTLVFRRNNDNGRVMWPGSPPAPEPTDTLWFGPPDHPGRAGLPLANPLGLSPEQQRQSDVSSMIEAVFGSASCPLHRTCGSGCRCTSEHRYSCFTDEHNAL